MRRVRSNYHVWQGCLEMEERQWSRMEWYPAQPRHYIIGAEHPPLCMALPVSPTIMPGLEMHCPGIAVSQTSQGNGSSRHAYKTTPRLTCSRTCHRVPPRKSSATLTFLSAPNPHPSATMPAAYRSTPLYGGALICELPTHFADVRYVRCGRRCLYSLGSASEIPLPLSQVPRR